MDEYFGLEAVAEHKFIVTRSDNLTELQEFTPAEHYRFKGKIDGGTISAAAMAAGKDTALAKCLELIAE